MDKFTCLPKIVNYKKINFLPIILMLIYEKLYLHNTLEHFLLNSRKEGHNSKITQEEWKKMPWSLNAVLLKSRGRNLI